MEFVYLGCSLVFVLVSWYWRKSFFLIPALFFCFPVMFNENVDQYFRDGVIIYFVIMFVALFMDVVDRVFN